MKVLLAQASPLHALQESMQCSQYLQDVHPSKEKERELQREKAVLVLCHLSSRGAAVSAYNDDVPASFLRDVAAYIAGASQ